MKNKAWADEETIICFDGGGIRGYASLRMLEMLMKAIYDAEDEHDFDNVDDMLPCHYFDYFYGTSTGGHIAIMLGRLRMTLGQAYKDLGGQIFHKDMKRWQRMIPMAANWSEKNLEDNINKLVDRRGPDSNRNVERKAALFTHMPSPSDLCKVGVITYEKRGLYRKIGSKISALTKKQPEILRTYEPTVRNLNSRNPIIKYDQITILQACRATSAAPGYFLDQKIRALHMENGVQKEVKHYFIDGGAGMNNPTFFAWNEVQSLRRQDSSSSTASTPEQERTALEEANKGLTMVSFGTGIPPKSSSFFKIGARLTDTEAVHSEMKTVMEDENIKRKPDHYFRFNVARELIKIPMDKFIPEGNGVTGTISDIDQRVNAAFSYPNDEQEIEMDQNLGTLAAKLISKRRKRMEDQPMWERITECYWHGCKHCHHQSFDDRGGAVENQSIDHTHFANWYTIFDDYENHIKEVKGADDYERWADEYSIEHKPFHTKGPW